jgi:hypothetical protein
LFFFLFFFFFMESLKGPMRRGVGGGALDSGRGIGDPLKRGRSRRRKRRKRRRIRKRY